MLSHFYLDIFITCQLHVDLHISEDFTSSFKLYPKNWDVTLLYEIPFAILWTFMWIFFLSLSLSVLKQTTFFATHYTTWKLYKQCVTIKSLNGEFLRRYLPALLFFLLERSGFSRCEGAILFTSRIRVISNAIDPRIAVLYIYLLERNNNKRSL